VQKDVDRGTGCYVWELRSVSLESVSVNVLLDLMQSFRRNFAFGYIPVMVAMMSYKVWSRIVVLWFMFSDDEQMYDDKGRDESDKYQDKGVEDEEGLRKLVDSEDEEEEDEDKKDEEIDDDDESKLKDDRTKGGSGEILVILSPYHPLCHSVINIFQ